MTTQTSLSSTGNARTMFRGLLSNMPEPATLASGCSGGCRAKTLSRFNRQGMSACQAGNLEEAASLLAQGVALARECGVDMYEAKLRNNLGLVFTLMRRTQDADQEFDAALGLVDSRLGRENALYRHIEGQRRLVSGNATNSAVIQVPQPVPRPAERS